MKSFIQKWNSISLIIRILIGMVIGAAIGVCVSAGLLDSSGWWAGPDAFIALLGSLFTGALKAVAPILVFFLVMSALANAQTAGNMKTIIVLYLVSTFVAALVAVIGCYIFPVDVTIGTVGEVTQESPQGIGEVLSNLLINAVSNPVGALVDANYIGILVWAVMLGIALRRASDNVKNVLGSIADAIGTVVRWIINCAPFGILGLVYSAVSTSGLSIFKEYGFLILLLVCCMLFIALVSNPLLVFLLTRKNPYPLVLRCLKDSGLTAFFTRSSAANIPVNMELCKNLGLNKDNYSVSIPLGATINMAGAAVTITVMAMTAARFVGLSVDIPTAVVLSALAALSACGASGVAGGSLLLIPLACSLFGIDPAIAVEFIGIGFIIGVIQDSCETALNSSSDVLFTATAEYRSWIKAGRQFTMGKNNTPLAAESEAADEAAEATEAVFPDATEASTESKSSEADA